ncbi:SMI1/KNR4 family protein [Embleya sp. NPDC127516]|uniref:SMI1/KNR4 family protein n=1 Tax=Embleya sp. NPDC127516 TaxID=3363990 RepID=UPI0038209059
MELARVLGAPLLNHDVDSDWRDFENGFEVRLPLDYKRFMSAYGPCVISDTLTLFHPRAPNADDSLSLRWKIATVSDVYEQTEPALVPYRIFPMAGGVFPIGHTPLGHQVFLRPRAARVDDGWSVLVDWGTEWLDYQVGFEEFLTKALAGDVHFFHDSVLEEPSYEMVGRVL